MNDLSPRQRKFCSEYVQSGVAEKAAIAAGYSRKTARAQAARLLTNVGVRACVDELQKKAAEVAEIKIDDVMRELTSIAFADIADFVEWDSDGLRLKPSLQLDELRRRAIIEVKQTSTGVQIRLADKISALDRIGKVLGMFVDRVEHTVGLVELMERGRARARLARQQEDRVTG